jgi:formylglycine-generating enzyme required for sulfatase activity
MPRSRGLLVLLVALAVGALAPRTACAEPPAAPTSALVPLGVNAFGAEEFLRTKDGAVVIRVPGGPFPRRPYEGREATQEPAPVEVASFLIDKHEVTNEQFARFLTAVRADAAMNEILAREWSRWWDPAIGGLSQTGDVVAAAPGRERHPVTAASAWGAMAYAGWVGGRLPHAVEWEKAASGTDGRLWPWGDEPPTPFHANYGQPRARGTSPVGSFFAGASPCGALDMAGNAYERVWAVQGRHDKAATPSVIKGGSWLSTHPLNLRVLDLCVQGPESPDTSVGFRCAMNDPEPARPAPKPAARAVLRLATSLDAAVKEARERRAPIFAAMLVDTCGQCDRVRAQVFADPRFVAYANEHLVVLVGHHPGDAQLDPHPEGPDGACPLYPGLTCDQHLVLFARLQEVLGAFRFSPGLWVLHPDRVQRGAGERAVLVPESNLPKNGTGVERFLAAFDEARAALHAPEGGVR